MKKITCAIFSLIFAVLLFSCPSTPDTHNAEPGAALIYFRDNNLGVGWNLGNSLDSHVNGVGGETEWGNPAINQALMNGVAAAGFTLIRIPITWMGYIGDAPDYTIDPARLTRIKQVVDMANTAGLKVIINLHHDGSSESTTKQAGWLLVSKASTNAAQKAEITARFTAVWRQIAEYFRDYDEWLIFESMNEIHDGGWAWSSAFRTPSGVKKQFEVLNEWNQVFTDTVRATGSKNTERFLVIPSYVTGPECTYSGGQIKDHPVSNVGGYFKLPNDSSGGRQIVTFHYYRPDAFALNGTQATWGSGGEKDTIDNAFRPFKSAYIDMGIPVIIGEIGAVRQLYPTDSVKQTQARQARLAYLGHVFATAKKYELVPIYWDNGVFDGSGERFGLFDRTTGQPKDIATTTEFKDCIDAMVKAVK